MERNSDKNSSRIFSFLLIGSLSMLFGEVLVGSSNFWFADIWGLLVVFPLYLLHIVFFLNLAMRTNRISIPQLYLWGVFFGLYEAILTKVLWVGYAGNEGPGFGIFLGFAWFEFLTLIFYHHPILSFILPILTYQLLAFLINNDDQKIIPFHRNYLTRNKKNTIFVIVAMILFPAGLSGSVFGIIEILAFLSSVLLIFVLVKLEGRRTNNNMRAFSIHSIRLGKRGMGIVTIAIILMYLVLGIVLNPQDLPTNPVYYLYLLVFYIFNGIILYLSKSSEYEESMSKNYFSTRSIVTYIIGFVFVVAIFMMVPGVGMVVFAILTLLLSATGLVYYIILIIRVFLRKELV